MEEEVEEERVVEAMAKVGRVAAAMEGAATAVVEGTVEAGGIGARPEAASAATTVVVVWEAEGEEEVALAEADRVAVGPAVGATALAVPATAAVVGWAERGAGGPWKSPHR